jgi:ketosteroid isomerase-like protein
MSQDNVEVVRQAIEAYRREGLDAALRYYDPEVEWDISRFMADGRVYHGHDGVREFWGGWVATWENFDAEIEQAIDAGSDEVVVGIRNAGRGRGSGIAVGMSFGQVWTVRKGKIVRLRVYPSLAEALEAAGLSE